MFSKRLVPVAKAAFTRSSHYTAPLRDMRFMINEVHDFPTHYKSLKKTGGENATPDMVDSILEESAKFASTVIAPLTVVGDTVGCKYVDKHTIVTPPGFKEAYVQFSEGGWQGLSMPEKYGGQGFPASMSIFQSDMACTANWAWTMYPGLSKGAINTIYAHGTEALKQKYLTRMISGEFTGTMCLTGAHCIDLLFV
jgi:alkylation response protein AidB-like acyl-CoA dehydrogenase